jgi:pimeloyl-ACP methyl ester carboxylesterase
LLAGLLLVACQLTTFVATPTPQAVHPSLNPSLRPPTPPVAQPSLNPSLRPPTPPVAQPSPARGSCGDGRCEGPENPRNCPSDCSATAAAITPTGSGGVQQYTVTNPASGASLAVYVNTPTVSSPAPALILVPGGSGGSSSFRKPDGEFYAFAQAGYVVIVFDPDGRGKSTGREDYNGFMQQDGLAAVIEFAAKLPQVDPARIGLISYSYGVTMASGVLARHPDLPVKFLIDWEGPANRDDTGGCDGAGLGHLTQVASCTDEAFWSQREASTFIGQIRVPYQRIQSEKDHVQPDNAHAILMVNNAVHGGVPWVRLNDLPPNQTYDPANPPAMLAEEDSLVLPALVLKYVKQMMATQLPLPTEASRESKAVLYLGIMVHLEGWGDDQNKASFERHVQLMRDYAALFEKYGAKLTWESKEVTEGILRWGDNVLLEMQRRGHGVGIHADIGGQRNYDCSRFAADLRAEREQLESLGVTVRHVSGICSHCDWVTAAADAGYLFTTGQVAYCVSSLPVEQRPEPYKTCPSPSVCHQNFPSALADRLHPWRMSNGANWTIHNPKGRLVLLPSSGGLACMQEESASSGVLPKCDFTAQDIDAFIQQLEEALSYTRPGQINIYYVSWSLGSPLDKALLEAWLQRIQPYVESGRVQWKTLPEMYDAYVRWEQSH